MQAILKLDVSGQPRGWLTLNEAVTAYARGDVLYGIGESLPPVFGGIQRLTGIRSEIILQPIVALEGRVMNHFTPPHSNRTQVPEAAACHPLGTDVDDYERTSTQINLSIGIPHHAKRHSRIELVPQRALQHRHRQVRADRGRFDLRAQRGP